jgi:hypothetical protein
MLGEHRPLGGRDHRRGRELSELSSLCCGDHALDFLVGEVEYLRAAKVVTTRTTMSLWSFCFWKPSFPARHSELELVIGRYTRGETARSTPRPSRCTCILRDF